MEQQADLRDFDPLQKKVKSDSDAIENIDPEYIALLDRALGGDTLKATTSSVPLPMVATHGRRVCWCNFGATCDHLKRPPLHLQVFIRTEIGRSCNLGQDGKLVITGRERPAALERLLRNYIIQYVQCPACKRLETSLEKEARLTFKTCVCGSRTSVPTLK